MTEDEFFNELETCKPFELKGEIIRQKDSDLCPILAVARKKNLIKPSEHFLPNSLHRRMSKRLELPPVLSSVVPVAADHDPESFDFSPFEDEFKQVRERLLKLC